MYYNNKINQASRKEKSLLIPSFSHKDSQTDHYIASCTPSQQTIASVFVQYRNAPWIRLSNVHIASLAGCTVRTVIRATNKFHKDGFITKHQVNKYATNYYTLNNKIKRGKYAFSHWINSLSPKNQELYISHGIRVDHKNRIICSFEYVTPNKNSLILNNLFINLSPSSRTRERNVRVFKKTKYPEKGGMMSDYQNRLSSIEKPKQKPRNDKGHSPAVLKPVLPLEDQIHSKKVDIAFFTKQLQEPETFWDPCSILFSVNVKMAESLLSKAREELEDLEAKKNGLKEDSDEKQVILYQNSSNSMAQGCA